MRHPVCYGSQLPQWVVYRGQPPVMPIQQEHQNWTGGALHIIKLMGMKISFSKILGKLKKIKLSENLREFRKFEEKKSKFCPVLNPVTS